MSGLRKHGLDSAAFVWGVAEATLFFLVPDIILSYIGLKRGVKPAARASLIAAIGAAVGGLIMYSWSAGDPNAARQAVLAVPAISEEMFARAEDAMGTHAWFGATILGPLSSTPFKVYAVLAPYAGASPIVFAFASILARLPRFLLVSIGVALLGRFLSRWLDERQRFWLLIGAWLLFYAVFFSLMPN